MQFGWYEDNMGSCPPSISLEEQQAITVAAAVDFLHDLDR
jgi:hypothetical protein